MLRALVRVEGYVWEVSRWRWWSLFLYLISLLFLSDWKPALHLAALDCAEETNSEVCRDFNIPGFPTVRVRDREGREGLALAARATSCAMLPRHPSPVASSDASGLDLLQSRPPEHRPCA